MQLYVHVHTSNQYMITYISPVFLDMHLITVSENYSFWLPHTRGSETRDSITLQAHFMQTNCRP